MIKLNDLIALINFPKFKDIFNELAEDVCDPKKRHYFQFEQRATFLDSNETPTYFNFKDFEPFISQNLDKELCLFCEEQTGEDTPTTEDAFYTFCNYLVDCVSRHLHDVHFYNQQVLKGYAKLDEYFYDFKKEVADWDEYTADFLDWLKSNVRAFDGVIEDIEEDSNDLAKAKAKIQTKLEGFKLDDFI